MLTAVCDKCGKTAPVRLGRIYALPPVNWYEEHMWTKGEPITGRLACSDECVQVVPGGATLWRLIKGRSESRPLVGQENCSWCKRLSKLCPAHAKQAAKFAAQERRKDFATPPEVTHA